MRKVAILIFIWFLTFTAVGFSESGFGIFPDSGVKAPWPEGSAGAESSICHIKLEKEAKIQELACSKKPNETLCKASDSLCEWLPAKSECQGKSYWLCWKKIHSLCSKINLVDNQFPASSERNRKYLCDGEIGNPLKPLPRGF